MSVACPGDILGRRLVLEGKGSGSDHFTRVGADDVTSENLISLFLNNL